MAKPMLALSFLLLNSVLCLAAEQPNPVRDIDGKELRTGTGYYILPLVRGSGGGVTFGGPINTSELCPLTVIQEAQEVDRGNPVVFTPVNPKKGVIRVSTDLNIQFQDAVAICINSNVWKLAFAEEIGKYVIETDGVEGNPGRETLSNWFKIEEFESDYKLVFCPAVCDFCRPVCGDVSIYFDQGGVRRLTLGEQPFRVFFKKAFSSIDKE